MVKAPWQAHGGAALLYAAAAWVFLCHGQSATRVIWGLGSDPILNIWFLNWWPYALTHHINPLYTSLVWQPAGVNLAWTTCVPVLALLAWPVTALCGPIAAYDALVLAAPVAAALAAYALCFYVTRQWPAALLGGYIFGFSTEEMTQSARHLNLAFTAFIPLLLLVVLARLDGRLHRPAAAGLAALLLAAQFGVSAELFATEILLGGLAWALAFASFPSRRPVLRGLVVDGLIAAPLLALLLAPFLYVMFALPHDLMLPASWPQIFSVDPFGLVVPSVNSFIGGALAFPIACHFTGLIDEQGAYMGVLLLGIVVAFCRRQNRFFGWLSAGIILLALGPQLWLNGVATGLPLPWALGERLPFLHAALPSRFMVYAFLLAGICTALWVAERPGGGSRLLIACLACLTLVPVLHVGQPDPSLRFFAPGRVQAALGPAPRLLILPFGDRGQSPFWQVENQFGFAETGGYLGPPPAALWQDPPMLRLTVGILSPGFAQDFAAYCRHTHTGFVVAAPATAPGLLAAVVSLGWPRRHVDDVTIFTVPHG